MQQNISDPTIQSFGTRINIQRVIKFLIVGAICTGFQYCLFFLTMRSFGLDVWWQAASVNAFAFAASTQINYALSSRFTWSDRHNSTENRLVDVSQMTRFNLMAVISLATNTFVFAATVPLMGHFPSLVAGTMSSLILSYLVSHRFVFASNLNESTMTAAQTRNEG